MSKIKVNLASGGLVEKPLVTCFKGTNGNYVILDFEANGSMGLPIIMISKLNGMNLEKILDPNEWNAVKDNLKTIIGGTTLPYLAVPETLAAQDDFFTQLTLPVASFDLLKSVYNPPADATAAAAPAPAPVAPTPAPATPEAAPAPVAPAVPTPPEINLATVPEVPVTPVASPATEIAPTPVATPVIEAPVINAAQTPVAPVQVQALPTEPVQVAPVQTVTPTPVAAPTPAPVQTPIVAAPEAPAIELPVSEPAVAPVAAPAQAPVAPAPTQTAVNPNMDIALIKETFMKSCENMFDALMKKFENK